LLGQSAVPAAAGPGAAPVTASGSLGGTAADQGSVSSRARQSAPFGAQRIGALVAGGASAAALAIGAVFGFEAIAKQNTAEKTCAHLSCTTDSGVAEGKDAQTAGNVATVSLILGGAGLAGGAILWFTTPTKSDSGNRSMDNSERTQLGLGLQGVTV